MLNFRFNTHSYFPESGSRKHFDASGMRWIDFSHKITLRTMILEEKPKIFIFALQYKHSFPWIRVREAFSSVGNARNRFSAWSYPQKYDFEGEISKFSIFASIHTSISLNQGQGSIFTLRECAQSIFRMILGLYRLFWQKKFSKKIFGKICIKAGFFWPTLYF